MSFISLSKILIVFSIITVFHSHSYGDKSIWALSDFNYSQPKKQKINKLINSTIEHQDKNKHKLALKSLFQVIELDPQYHYAYYLTALSYFNLNKTKESLKAINDAIRLNPNKSRYYFLKAKIYNHSGRYFIARNHLNKAMKLDNNPEYYFERAQSYAYEKKFKHALKDLDEAEKNLDLFYKIEQLRGNIYAQKYNLTKALGHYSQSIKLKPAYAKSYIGRALVHYSLEKYQLALVDINKYILLQTDKLKLEKALHYKALVHFKLRQLDEAMLNINKIIAMNPRTANYYNLRAILYFQQKQYKQSIKDSSKAIELKPDYLSAYNLRAEAYKQLSQYKKAIQDYTLAISIKENPFLLQSRAQVYKKLNMDLAAKTDLKKAKTLLSK